MFNGLDLLKIFYFKQIILFYHFVPIVSGSDDVNHNNYPANIEHENVHFIYQHFWIIQFLKNIFDYLIVILPIGLLILLVKYTDLLPSYGMGKLKLKIFFMNFKFSNIVKQNKFIQYLVYGTTNESTIEDGLPLVVDSDNKSERPKKNVSFLNLLFCFFGLQISFLTWGILQEKIMTQNYSLKHSFINSHAGELSDNLITIVSTGRLVCNKFFKCNFILSK